VIRMAYELAQVNIARLVAPLDAPRLADFVAALDPVNAEADAAPGFVWRLQTEDGNATAVQAFEWDVAASAGIIVNMSVWTSVQTLGAFVYGADHRKVLRRRREWFQRMTGAYLACRWIPAGHRPGRGRGRGAGAPPSSAWSDAVRVHASRSLPAARGHRREGSQRPSRLVVPRLTLSLSHSAATVISASSARWCSGSCSCRNAGSR